MTTLRFCYLNDGDFSIISTGAAAITSLPAANLKDEDIEKIWRSSSSTGDAVIIDLGSQLEVGVIALLNLSGVTTNDNVQFRISTADPTGVDGSAYNSGNYHSDISAVWEKLVHFVEPAATGRYIRISLAATSQVEAGRLVVGKTWTPTSHFAFGFQPIWRDQSRQIYSLGQNVFTDIQKRQRGYRFTMRGLTTTEVQEQVAEMNRQRGIGRDILICLDVASTNLGRDTIWGLMEEPVIPTQIERGLWEVEGTVWERL